MDFVTVEEQKEKGYTLITQARKVSDTTINLRTLTQQIDDKGAPMGLPVVSPISELIHYEIVPVLDKEGKPVKDKHTYQRRA